jgi:prevent-host-death family protein
MHKLYQTIAAGDLKANTNQAFAMAEKGPVVILSRATPKAVLVSPDEWNKIAQRLKTLEALQEALRIEDRNEANQTWVTSSEMKTRIAKRGLDVGSSL